LSGPDALPPDPVLGSAMRGYCAVPASPAVGADGGWGIAAGACGGCGVGAVVAVGRGVSVEIDRRCDSEAGVSVAWLVGVAVEVPEGVAVAVGVSVGV